MTAKGMVMIQNKVVNTFKRLEYAASLLYIIFLHSRCGFSESIVLQCVQDHNKKVNKLSEQNYLICIAITSFRFCIIVLFL